MHGCSIFKGARGLPCLLATWIVPVIVALRLGFALYSITSGTVIRPGAPSCRRVLPLALESST